MAAGQAAHPTALPARPAHLPWLYKAAPPPSPQGPLCRPKDLWPFLGVPDLKKPT